LFAPSLELAVRGKLVPQDPSDEPASVLLERIAAEKTRLVKEGKIKKPKALPEIGEEEKPFELPDGWVWSMLAEIAEINPRNESDDTVDASFVPMSLISTAYNGQHEFEARKWGEIKKGFTHFSNGDIGIAKITPCFENSKAAVFRGLTNGIGAGTTELHIARPYTDYVSAFFILLNIKSPIYLKKGEAGMTGTAGQKRLAKDFFSFYPLPIPPFAEQHRIVAKVDELMALCDQLEQCSESQLAAHQTLVETLLATLTDSCDADELAQNWARLSTHFDTLFTTEASIDALKQTILQLAVMGKLVPQDPSDEPASALLERIAAEKALLVKEKKIKKEKPLPMIRAEEQLFELPIGWEWVRFSQVAHSRLGKMLDNAKNIGNELPYLRNTNVQWDLIELDDIKQMKIDDNEKDELALRYGDLLICEGGEPGRCAIWKHHNKEMYFQKALHRARPYQGVMAEYLQICLTNDAATGTLEQYFTGATIKHFVGAKLNEYSIPLPPTAVQKLIVAKVDELTTLCDQLKSRLQTSQQTQLALAESLVEGALA
ncbi:restriction endonuclease subunit S, partial [Aeromonas veronii]|uniref:restriction endonuclease subunit S n=2 Tax=Aeromonas TaxID=642 RepID=UPI00111A8DDE